MNALQRFMQYVRIETTSCEEHSGRPSTPCQMDLTRLLAEEMREMGLEDVWISEADGAAFGTIPANCSGACPKIGFLAHVDTAPDASGRNVTPRIVTDYDGGKVVLSEDVVMDPEGESACLREVVGEDLIVTDGTTLLGADDKAGVAEIMTMAELLLHSDRPHGTVKIGFTTDEEIGEGPQLFDVARFGCDFAYTVDGGPLGEIEYENFNAASAKVEIQGVGVHPGSAKNTMVNAAAIAAEFHSMLPKWQVPEHTEQYEGFIHLTEISGDVTRARLSYILRDHDLAALRMKEALIADTAEYLNGKYGRNTVRAELKETYFNMKEKIQPHMHLIRRAEQAFASQGVEAKIVAIRGGTDGAVLSFMGLPCPNLSTGGYQFHGVREFIPVRALETMPKVLCEIVYSLKEEY